MTESQELIRLDPTEFPQVDFRDSGSAVAVRKVKAFVSTVTGIFQAWVNANETTSCILPTGLVSAGPKKRTISSATPSTLPRPTDGYCRTDYTGRDTLLHDMPF